MPDRRIRRGRILAVAAFVGSAFMLTLSSCDSTVDVFVEGDQYFSLFGYLDAAADTQWVRVKDLQDSTRTGSAGLNAVMTMTALSSGETAEWRDSVVTLLGGGRAHAFWVPLRVEALETYRVEVRRPDGAASVATVTLPDTLPDPVFSAYPFIEPPFPGTCMETFRMQIEIESLAAAEIFYYVPTLDGIERVFSEDYIESATRYEEEGYYTIVFRWAADLAAVAALRPDVDLDKLVQLRAVEVRVAAAGPNWPDYSLDDETLALPGVGDHVENGLGFVGGVVSERFSVPVGEFRSRGCFL